MIRFQHVEYLWLLLLVPIAILLYVNFLSWRKRKIRKIGDPHLVNSVLKGRIAGRSTTKLVCLSLSLICAIFAMANLQSGGKAEKSERKGLDIFFALDVSNSMLARDVSPDRISSAKQLIFRMVDKMKNDRAGLVIFAGKSYLQVPLTIDYSALKMILSSVNPGMIPTQGTVLANALELANSSFQEKEKKHKAIILISDGEDHDANAEEIAKKAKKDGTVLFTVGIGSPQGSTIYDPTTGREKINQNGDVIITKLNEQELQHLASVTGGSYVHLNNVNSVADLLIDEIAKMEKKSLGEIVFTDYKSYFQYFLSAALVFLLLGWMLPNAGSLFPKKTAIIPQ